MSFVLTNALSTFMRLMNYILCALIGRFIVVYFDGILIYSKGFDKHIDNLRHVLNVFRKKSLYANLKKYEFCKENIMFSWICC
jgi:hypothetical protein